MATLNLVLVLVVAVVLSSWIGRLLPFVAPPLVQIALGALMGRLGLDAVGIEPQLFFVLFLPPLLFLDGWRFSGRELLARAGPIASLAVGLVIVTVLTVGPALGMLMPGLPLISALALVAVLSPTDAIAGLSLLAKVPLARRVLRIVEGEALLNDASALICLHYVLLLGSNAAPSGPTLLAELLWVGTGGLAIGAGVSLLLLPLKNAISARLGETTAPQILISLLLPYAAYHAAVALGASGILAPVAAGMVMGRWELGGTALPLTRLRRRAIWETLEFTLNGFIFVLLGAQLPRLIARTLAAVPASGQATPLQLALLTLATFAALTLVRLVWLSLMMAWQARACRRRGRQGDECPRSSMLTILAMTFSGVRGAVTLAAALSLPLVLPDGADLPARSLVIAIAASIILLSLLVANLVLPWLAGRIEATEGEDGRERAARLRTTAAAMAAIDRTMLRRESATDEEDIAWREASAAILAAYRARLKALDAPAEDGGMADRRAAAERQLRLAALRAERAEIAGLVAGRLIDEEAARRLMLELDSQEAGLGG